MKLSLSLLSPLFAAALLAGAAGCATTSTPAEARGEAVAPEINRNTAISLARSDASVRFRELLVADVTARRTSGYWVVELRSPTGSGLRYAIAVDGSIRERNVFQ